MAKFKETTIYKILQAVDAIWAPGTDFSKFHDFLTIHEKKDGGMKIRMHIWLHI